MAHDMAADQTFTPDVVGRRPKTHLINPNGSLLLDWKEEDELAP